MRKSFRSPGNRPEGAPGRGAGERGQALVETAVALPLLVLLFMGCAQLCQIGLAHILVMDAVYEAGRQAELDRGQTERAARVAREICARISPGATEFRLEGGKCWVVHHLKAVFPLVKSVVIRHSCPDSLFHTLGEP